MLLYWREFRDFLEFPILQIIVTDVRSVSTHKNCRESIDCWTSYETEKMYLQSSQVFRCSIQSQSMALDSTAPTHKLQKNHESLKESYKEKMFWCIQCGKKKL